MLLSQQATKKIKLENIKHNWVVCDECNGYGQKHHKLNKKALRNYKIACEEFEKINGEGVCPIRPSGHAYVCAHCAGIGLVPSASPPIADKETFPHVAIIGGGIGGMALAVALLHRKIPFTMYERDANFDARSQGYGLTLQQARKAVEGLGIFSFDDGVVSTRHVVHTTDGKIIGEWGMRKWVHSNSKPTNARTNIHIARQALRLALFDKLHGHDAIKWGHELISFKEIDGDGISLNFNVHGEIKTAKANLLVGADGIRSTVRKLLIGEDINPLRYLGCIVILGICPLSALHGVDSPLLDSETVFQTANGNERIYMMPYNSSSIMWQLSFPMSETEAKALSAQGVHALKTEACKRTQWHNPIPQIVLATLETQITGYPVYDRDLLKPEFLETFKNATLIGDAAHPMSPFKGQGANQALLDSLALARGISKRCKDGTKWKELGLRETVLKDFESDMLKRIASKVIGSAEAAKFLHSNIVLHEGDMPRGRCLDVNKNTCD